MKQNDIKAGMLLKFFKNTRHLEELGFELGRIYEVFQENDSFIVTSDLGYRGRECIGTTHELFDSAYCFTEIVCPVILARGTGSILE